MDELNVKKIRRDAKINQITKNVILLVILSAIGITMIMPFIWMISTSLKESGAVFTYPPEFIPRSQLTAQYEGSEYGLYTVNINGKEEQVIKLKIFKDAAEVKIYRNGEVSDEVITVNANDLKPLKKVKFIWKNYADVFDAVPFARFYLNSIIVSLLITVGQVLTSSLAAYAFARLQFKFRNQLFLGYLATMMIPGTVTMIPVFIIIKKLGWIDTYQALILPMMFSAYGTFMLRQFFLSIPKDLEESAVIDGATKFRIYWQIILPLSKPALATLTIFVFLGAWNDFMWPLIVTNSMEMKTLPVGLAAFQGLYTTNWTLLMAASMMALLPVLILYILAQKYFEKGIVLSGLKG